MLGFVYVTISVYYAIKISALYFSFGIMWKNRGKSRFSFKFGNYCSSYTSFSSLFPGIYIYTVFT